MPTLLPTLRAAAALALLMTLLGGCDYTIRGRVVQSDMSIVQWVPEGSPLPGAPVQGATVSIVRDPNGMSPTTAGQTTTGADGSFALKVDGFGAGWMEEVWLIRASRQRVGVAEAIERLPGSPGGQWLILSLAPLAPGAKVENMWRGDLNAFPSHEPRPNGESILDEVNRYR